MKAYDEYIGADDWVWTFETEEERDGQAFGYWVGYCPHTDAVLGGGEGTFDEGWRAVYARACR